MTKTCQNPLCQKSVEPEPRLEKRQRYCSKCAQLPVKARQRTEPIADKVCINPSCRKVFTPRANLLGRQRYCNSACREDHRRIKARKGGARNCRHSVPVVTAICPRCERTHKLALDWRGRGMPRMYCKACDIYLKSETFSGTGQFDHIFQASF